ncbi:MAG TPA: NADH-quinone oxidoreductase subunit NuoG [Chloroflexota bacterium]|nr:NADH-quinone oxidoreductase subunit NuoG [Chloroflexota bacterium]
MENTVKVTINGKQYTVPKGMGLVDAAKSVGIEIPIFCYHPKMKPVGACRMCLVEIEKAPKLQTACTTTVADGMVVQTTSAKAVAGQNAVIEFLLLNHPLDCPVCDKGGECPLQDNTFAYGKGISQFEDIKRHFVKPIPLSDKVLLDRERCIMCYRCVRFTKEIAGDESLTVLERGSWSQIGLAEGRTFDSPFSGNTIEICPVGALTSSLYRFKARPWDIKTQPSVCSLCSVGCNINLTVREGKIARVLSRENTPVDDGWICDRGRFEYEFVASEGRLTQPLIRKNGQLEPASWTEALNLIRDSLTHVVQSKGARAVGAMASPRGTSEEGYLLQKLMRGVLGTNNVDYSFEPHPARTLPYDAATGSIAGLEKANTILLADVDPIKEQPVLDLRLKKAAGKGSKLIVIGPEKIDLVSYAALWLATPADKVARVAQGLLAAAVQENLVKPENVANADGIIAAARATDLDAVAAETGVSRANLVAAAKLYAEAGNASVLYRRTNRHPGLAAALVDLALLTGQIGRPGAAVYPLVREANEQGMLDVGAVPHRLPGQRSLEDRAVVAEFWGANPPTEAGLSGAELFGAARDRVLSALYLIGQDPVASYGPEAADALARLDFLVVQDIFLTETAKLATVVLPGAAFAEKDGTYTNLERRVQRLKAAVLPPGEAKPDWAIIRDVANALGADFDYSTAADVLTEIALTVPMYAGLTMARLGSKGVQWPRGAKGAGAESLYGEEGTRLDAVPLAADTRVGSTPT